MTPGVGSLAESSSLDSSWAAEGAAVELGIVEVDAGAIGQILFRGDVKQMIASVSCG